MTVENGVGLVGRGGVSLSFLARIPALLARLGPIKAYSYRVACQISNSLRAGYAVSHYSALAACPAIWIWTPEPLLDRTLLELKAKAAMNGTMVVLCDSIRDSGSVERLPGARVATLNPIPDSNERVFVAEGHPETLRMLRQLLAESGRKLIGLKPGGKPLYFAGVHAASSLLLPWIGAAVDGLRASGFSYAEAARVCEFLGARALRQYAKTGSNAWNRAAGESLRRALEHDLPAIRSQNRELADLYEQGIRIALARFELSATSAAVK
ncbi:MAG TPA: hypothetical protein VFW83_03895 [Bryobacteraceae bacterium]|nr:hypothetical protein [Bryobacteraceae bacterium]